MTDLEKFNLYWLCNAMTTPINSKKSYYYDALHHKFFYLYRTLQSTTGMLLFDCIDLPLQEFEQSDLIQRLNNIDLEVSDILEIPRLNVSDKISIQLLFLSKFPGIKFENELILDVENQADVHKFVLDVALTKTTILEPMLPYWEDFKLKTIQYYLENYTGVVGIAVRLTQ